MFGIGKKKQEKIEKLIETRVAERVSAQMKSLPFTSLSDGFRRLSQKDDKDLEPMTQEKHQKIAYYLYKTNPLGRRIIEYTKVFTVGGKITIKADDQQLKKALDVHWKKNKWDVRKGNKAKELGLYGEQCYPVFVDEITGVITLGYVDPTNIQEVILNEENPEVREEIIIRCNAKSGGSDTRKYKIINEATPKEKLKSGTHCFFFTVNDVSNASRGNSDLLALEDWIDAYGQIVFKFVERAELMQAFIWDVSMKNASEQDIINRRDELQGKKPKAGSFVVHSDDEEWTQVTPDLRARENIEEARHMKNGVLGGAAFPEWFFAEGEKTTRATALAQGTPTFRVFEERQDYIKYMIHFILEVQIGQYVAVNSELIKGVKDYKYEVIMPDIEVKDYVSMSDALTKITASITAMLTDNTVTYETAVKMTAFYASKLGYEIDGDAEWEKLKEETGDEFMEKYNDLIEKLKGLKNELS